MTEPTRIQFHSAGAARRRTSESDVRPVLVLCEVCQSEGRILRSNGGPDDIDHGECPECKGSGFALVDSEPMSLEDALEADGEKLRHLTGEDHGPHFVPPAPRKPFTPPLAAAHKQMVDRLGATKPNNIMYEADHIDLERRAEHLVEIRDAAVIYIGALVRDTMQLTPGGLAENESYLVGLIEDAFNTTIGQIEKAAERAHEDAAV